MFESGAINTYLGDKYRSGKSKLVPWAGTKKRGVYEQTLSVLGTELDAQGLWIHRKHKDMGKFFTFVPDAVTHARKYFNKTNRSLMEQLRNNGPYLLGEDFTAVDIYWVHCLDWSQEIGWDDKWKDSASILEYLKICKSRPAYIKITEMKRAEQAAIRKRKAKAKKRSKL
jgi:glutathione S-transferase